MTQDATTGHPSATWSTVQDNLPASIMSAASVSSGEDVEASAERPLRKVIIRTRFVSGITELMRIVHADDGNRIYNIREIKRDPTMRRDLLLRCETGVNQG
ncbi:MAG: head-tail adaptor protein [Xanthomonadales bacterium]|nr:head-tail adaptor protein [Xanthomonadales bacterium]